MQDSTAKRAASGRSLAAGLLAGLRQRLTPGGGLDVDSLLASARRYSGLTDFGGQDFLPALRLLANSIRREAGLPTGVRTGQRWMLVDLLKRRLYIQRDLVQHPEILDVALPQPIFIVSMPRSGSTLLQNLLLADPGRRWLREWEVGEPWPAERGDGEDPREHAYREKIARSRAGDGGSSQLDLIHAVDSPADCGSLFLPTFHANDLAVALDIPSYEQWLLQLSWEAWVPPYEYYRRELQRLLWYAPGGCWVLKSPMHLGNLRALTTVFPDARILHLHRDPLRVVPSTCSMVNAVRMQPRGPQPEAIGRFILRRLASRSAAAIAARDVPTTAQVQDVHYLDLLHDPLGTMERIYAGFGLQLMPETRERMAAWLRDNPQHKRGVHRYAAADYGLDPAEVRRTFAAYCERFQVQSEAS